MYDVRNGLYYTNEHEWVMVDGKRATFGMTDFAQHELGDVVYVDLPNVGDDIVAGDEIGATESVKSIEPIYAPVTGKVLEVNSVLSDEPQILNSSPYEDGWLAVVELVDLSEVSVLMTADEYRSKM